MQKYVPLVKQNVMELEVFILGGQRIDQKRKGAEREKEQREKRDNRELSWQFEEEDKEHQHLPLIVIELPTAFLLSP